MMGKRNIELEELIKREWLDPEIKSEFQDNLESYRAYRRADHKGLIKYQITERLNLNELLKIIENPAYRDTESVKRFVTSLRARSAAKKRRGKEGPMKQTIRMIMMHTDAKNFDSLLCALENEELMMDLFSARHEPIPWEIIEVDVENKTVLFRTRTSKDEERSFSRIKTIISEIKKNQR